MDRFGRELVRLIEDCLQQHQMLRHGKIYVKASTAHEICMAAMFADSLRVFQAEWLLLRRKSVGGAAILNRSLFERLVDVLYLSKSKERRARRFLRYWDINRRKLHIKIKKEFDFPPDNDVERMKKFNDLRRRAATYRYGGRDDHWSGRAIWKRAEVVGLSRFHRISGHEYNSYVHSDPVSALETIKTRSYGFTCEYTGYSQDTDHLLGLIRSEALKFELILFLVFANTFGLQLPTKLDGLIRNVRDHSDFKACYQANTILRKSGIAATIRHGGIRR